VGDFSRDIAHLTRTPYSRHKYFTLPFSPYTKIDKISRMGNGRERMKLDRKNDNDGRNPLRSLLIAKMLFISVCSLSSSRSPSFRPLADPGCTGAARFLEWERTGLPKRRVRSRRMSYVGQLGRAISKLPARVVSPGGTDGAWAGGSDPVRAYP
jgi:hypothetical protein